MPTNAIILATAPAACVLAGNAISEGSSLFGKRIDPLLDQKIYATYFIIKKIYDNDPNYAGMDVACQYLWELMGQYGVRGRAYTGGGGMVAPSTTQSSFPIYVTSSDFTDATNYDNPALLGQSIMIFMNEINRYLYPPQHSTPEFEMTGTGVNILLDGFDAQTNDYNLVIERVSI